MVMRSRARAQGILSSTSSSTERFACDSIYLFSLRARCRKVLSLNPLVSKVFLSDYHKFARYKSYCLISNDDKKFLKIRNLIISI